MGTVLYVVVMLFALPVYGLVVLSINLFYPGQGLAAEQLKTMNNPLIWMAMFICVLVAVWVLRWLASEPEALGFCFDEDQQRLTFTQCRPARTPTEHSVPYRDILRITPCKMTHFGFVCHFAVCFAGADGKQVTRELPIYLTEQETQFHAEWLRRSIGERMQEISDLDK